MGADGGALPQAVARDADAAVRGRRGDSEDVEAVAEIGVGFVVEEGLRGGLGVGEEDVGFGGGVAFSEDDYVNAVGRGAAVVRVEGGNPVGG